MTAAAEPRRRVRVGAYAILTRDDHVLLSRFVDGDDRVWSLPGGGLDHGEDPVDAVVREVFEESGYLCEVDVLLGIDSTMYAKPPLDDVHGVRVVYEARIVGGELRHEVDGSSDRAQWFPLDAVQELKRFTLVDRGLDLYRARPRTGRVDGAGS